jgi:hypothetical protein
MAYLMYDEAKGWHEEETTHDLAIGGFALAQSSPTWFRRIEPKDPATSQWVHVKPEEMPAKMRTEALLLGIHL